MAGLLKCGTLLLLTSFLALVSVRGEWILAPRKLVENEDYTSFDFIAKIRSDKENFTAIRYQITGPGVDQDPKGRFAVDPNTGYVKVYTIFDREEIPVYYLNGVAKFLNGSRAEKDIALTIEIVDMNDNAPVIQTQQVGEVDECSSAGTLVMKVIGTDADDKRLPHAQIAYQIDAKSNGANMFYIDSRTGDIKVKQSNLDRETKDVYKLNIIASDMNGKAGGNSGSGEIEIRIRDINDNVPVLEKESYEASVEENTIGMEVLRIKATDMDLSYTDSWLAVFEIVSGNEGGYFNITTDSKTNEGIITINKALDYEEIQSLNLDLKVANKAEYNFGSGSMTGAVAGAGKSYPIKINVINQKEGPRFQPNVKVVTVSEDTSSVSINKVITTYAAIDSDTLKTATNVRYAKLHDEDNWLSVDETTAEIKLNKLPDRESKYLKNGTYYAEIICISNDLPSKTATGTIAIQVEDFNDHCPELTTKTQNMCFDDTFIYVTAVDKDEFPNSAPFHFTVIGDNKQKWTVEPLNETTVILRDQAHLWPGKYSVQVEVTDQQGKSCADAQIIDLLVCTCQKNTKTCGPRSSRSSVFGVGGILLLLLGLLLLLLIPLLLLFCLCGNAAREFKAIPFDAKEQLISYHTEGQGEDKEVPLLQVPVNMDGGTLNAKDINIVRGREYMSGLVETDRALGGGLTMTGEDMYTYDRYGYSSGQEYNGFMGGEKMGGQDMRFSHREFGAFDGMALSDNFLWQYYSQKANEASQQYQENELSQVYGYEGQGSLAGSVGCCSLLENDNDLAFLDDLGPKFLTLAEICHGGSLVSKSANVEVSRPIIKPVPQVRPSTMTHVHTRTETARDRDTANINTLNTSKVTSESSTIIQEERVTERSQGSATVPNVQVREKVVIPNQTLLIQQPTMYYAATPMYVVESKPQMVLVSGGTQQAVGQVSQAGFGQGIMQVGGLQGSQVGHVSQAGFGQGLMQVGGLQGSQGVVLVDGQVGMSGATRQAAQGPSQGKVSESTQVFVVKNGSAGGKHSTHLVQDIGQIGRGSSDSNLEARGKGVQVKTFSMSSHGSAGSREDFAQIAAPKIQGNQKVVMQHKKVSMIKKNTESSTSL
ncbi:desmoglein-2 [Nematolebias whitei]|uniref:desmoglein-2 n=1 Tax=Nematolebias whitei TaxID=451745 RepID=UPI0018975DDC|nr:desmoglein-2 [Nematolebias whitei]